MKTRPVIVFPLDEELRNCEKAHVEFLISWTFGNVAEAAVLAKRHRQDFYKLLKRHGLKAEDYVRKGAVRLRKTRGNGAGEYGSIAEKIRGALKDAPRPLRNAEIAERAGIDSKIVGLNVGQLKGLVRTGERGSYAYALA